MSTQFTNRQWRLPNAWNGSESNVNKQSNYSMYFNNASTVNLGTPSSGIGVFNKQVFSFSVWVKRERQNVNETIVNLFASSSNKGVELKFQYYAADGNYLCLQIGDGYNYSWYNNRVTNINSIMSLNVWYNITCTWDGTDSNIYINNVLRKNWTRNLTISYITSNQPAIGVAPNNSSKYLGQIDSFSYFDYALSSSQITTLYGSSSTGIGNPMSLSPKPVAFYQLGDKSAFNGANYLVPNSSLKDYVFDFDGSNDYIDCGTGLGDSIGDNYAGSLTASLWFKRSSNTLGGLINFTTSGWGEFTVLTYTNFIRFGINATTYPSIQLDYNATNGYTYDTNWHHLAVVMTPNGSVTDIKMYFDGQLLTITPSGTSPTPDQLDFAGKKLYIGTWDGATYSFNGSISNTQIFNTALPATGSNSVETLYNNGSPLTSMSGFTSLQGWWKLDASATYDGSNWTIPDSSSNSNTGTSSGMTQANLVQSDLSFKTSISPFALDFDGTNDYISCGNDTSLEITGNFTISTWVNLDTMTSYKRILGKANSNNSRANYGLGLFDGYRPGVIANATGTWFTNYSSTALSTGVWHHLVGLYDGSNFILYVNGFLDNSTSVSGFNIATAASGTSGDNLLIGALPANTENFNGSISNASIWNTNLTSSQVTELYNEGVPSNLNNHSAYLNLVSWWQLGSNSSYNTNWTVLDEKGSNNGTSVNMGEDAITDGVNSYANGVSSGMSDNIVGSAPFSDANSLSVNMDVLDRVTDTPS